MEEALYDGKGRPVCEANFRRFGQIPHGARLLGKDTDLYQSFDLARSAMVEVISNGATETRLFCITMAREDPR